uniref:Acylphosphatase n=1 Tax=Strigamia maritima TaxID=126957 RepID=T1IQP0_STRMM
MLSVDYEVFGKVQGVFFRKYTQHKAKELGLTGWVRNTSEGTVVGQMEGDDTKVSEMKHWLQNVGSPQSRIDKCEFKNEKQVSKTNFSKFLIKS